MREIRACFVGAFDSVAPRHGAKPQPIDLRKDVPHPMRALAPVLYLRQGTFVIVLLRQEKAVEIVRIIHRRKVRLATGKV